MSQHQRFMGEKIGISQSLILLKNLLFSVHTKHTVFEKNKSEFIWSGLAQLSLTLRAFNNKVVDVPYMTEAIFFHWLLIAYLKRNLDLRSLL